MRRCSFSTRGSPRTVRMSSNSSRTLKTCPTHPSLVATLLFLPIDSFISLAFVWQLRQGASAFRSLLVDTHTPASLPHATDTISDFEIDTFQIRLPHERNVGLKDSKLCFCNWLLR